MVGFHGDLAEALFYDRTLSDPERLAVETYLQNRYDCPSFSSSASSEESSTSSEESSASGESWSPSSEESSSSSAESSSSSEESSSSSSESSSSESSESSESSSSSSEEYYESSSSSGQPAVSIEPSGADVATVDQNSIYFTAIAAEDDSEDGATIEWEVMSGGGSLGNLLSTIENGTSTVELGISSAEVGSIHKVRARVKYLSSGEPTEDAPWAESGGIELFPGDPASLSITKNKEEVYNDGTDTVELEATVVDSRGNPVLDGTVVGWELEGTDATWVSFEEETTDGKAKAVLRAPLIAGDIGIEISAGGEAIQSETIPCHLLDGSLTSTRSVIDLGGSGETLTASVNAADGTPVYWFSTNGQITGSATVQNGKATATLSAEGAELRGVTVTALAGGKLLTWEGEFIGSHNPQMGVADKLLVKGGGSYTVDYPSVIGGSVTIPLKESTELSFEADANSLYSITVPSYISLTDESGNAMTGTENPDGTYTFSREWTQDGRRYLAVMVDSSAPEEARVPITVSKGQQITTTELTIAKPEMVGFGTAAIKALLGQGGNSTTEQALSLLGGLVAGDVQDGVTILSNFSKLIGTSEGEFNAAETMWAAGSLAVNFIPGGFFGKRAIIALSKIAGKVGKTSKLGKFLTSRYAKASRLEASLQAYEHSGELAFIEKIADDSNLLSKLDAPKADDTFINRCIKIDQAIGDRFWDKIKSSDFTAAEVQKIVGVIGDGSPEVIELLKNGGKLTENTLETAVDGIQAALKEGHTQASLKRVLNKQALDTDTYNRADLLTDLGKLGQDGKTLAERPGMKKLVERVGYRGPYTAGRRYEFQAAAGLEKSGYQVRAVNTNIPFDEGYLPKSANSPPRKRYTDIDVVAVKNGQAFQCNVKSSATALNGGVGEYTTAEAVRKLKNWLGAVKKKEGTLQNVRFVVPPGTGPNAEITAVLEAAGLDFASIKIEIAP